MNERKFFKIRLYFTATIAIAIWALLAWNHYHGGVPSHHIAANKELPEISNWWGALLLPLLTLFLTYRIQKRVFGNKDQYTDTPKHLLHALYGFAGALLFGSLISVSFSFEYADITGYMVLGLLPLAIFFPIYRAECLLGFVISMTFTFGAVLPTGFGTVLILVSTVLCLYIRPGILYVLSKFALLASLSKQKPHQ
jgi:hypothetical protein